MQPLDFGTGRIYRHITARRGVSNAEEWFTVPLSADGRSLASWAHGFPVVAWKVPHPPQGRTSVRVVEPRSSPFSPRLRTALPASSVHCHRHAPLALRPDAPPAPKPPFLRESHMASGRMIHPLEDAVRTSTMDQDHRPCGEFPGVCFPYFDA